MFPKSLSALLARVSNFLRLHIAHLGCTTRLVTRHHLPFVCVLHPLGRLIARCRLLVDLPLYRVAIVAGRAASTSVMSRCGPLSGVLHPLRTPLASLAHPRRPPPVVVHRLPIVPPHPFRRFLCYPPAVANCGVREFVQAGVSCVSGVRTLGLCSSYRWAPGCLFVMLLQFELPPRRLVSLSTLPAPSTPLLRHRSSSVSRRWSLMHTKWTSSAANSLLPAAWLPIVSLPRAVASPSGCPSPRYGVPASWDR